MSVIVACLSIAASSVMLQCTPAGPDKLAVNLWYGDHQRFGHLGGHPQTCINILGQTSPADRIASLSYTVNGSAPRPLSFLEDRQRLACDGDFNLEIERGELASGTNNVVITAISKSGVATHTGVTVDYQDTGQDWPLPFAIDWSAVTSITDAVQVVDGRWRLTADGVRTDHRYYDRILAFGDASWTDYEVRTTVIVHAVTAPKTGANITNVAHAAIALRWPGHDADGRQPRIKWYPLGATAEFRLGADLSQCRWRIFDGKQEFYVESDRRRRLTFDTPYAMVHRVETLADGRSRYRVKLWPQAEDEPPSWDLERLESDDLTAGSALLLAHHADVTFGNVTVRSLR